VQQLNYFKCLHGAVPLPSDQWLVFCWCEHVYGRSVLTGESMRFSTYPLKRVPPRKRYCNIHPIGLSRCNSVVRHSCALRTEFPRQRSRPWMAPQASEKFGLLPPDHLQIGCCKSNGITSGQVSGKFSRLTISSLSPQAFARSEKRFLTPFSILAPLHASIDHSSFTCVV